jgi:flagellar biosynthesis protein FliP
MLQTAQLRMGKRLQQTARDERFLQTLGMIRSNTQKQRCGVQQLVMVLQLVKLVKLLLLLLLLLLLPAHLLVFGHEWHYMRLIVLLSFTPAAAAVMQQQSGALMQQWSSNVMTPQEQLSCQPSKASSNSTTVSARQ